LYLIGEPGSGKSTFMRALTDEAIGVPYRKPVAHLLWNQHVVELGARRGAFAGTDAMPMNVQPRAVAFLEAYPCDYWLAEGDRLANDKFFTTVTEMGYQLNVVLIDPGEEVAARRRRQRAKFVGKTQNETWVVGRKTKTLRLAESWATFCIAGELAPEEQVRQLAGHPVVAALR
jgi:P-loop Nucleotide Kinase3